jgi:hypothetical protein
MKKNLSTIIAAAIVAPTDPIVIDARRKTTCTSFGPRTREARRLTKGKLQGKVTARPSGLDL